MLAQTNILMATLLFSGIGAFWCMLTVRQKGLIIFTCIGEIAAVAYVFLTLKYVVLLIPLIWPAIYFGVGFNKLIKSAQDEESSPEEKD
jgi:hypothetical protein